MPPHLGMAYAVFTDVPNFYSPTQSTKLLSQKPLIKYSNISSQLDATITDFIDNYYQLDMFRAIISPILRSNRLCLQLVVKSTDDVAYW